MPSNSRSKSNTRTFLLSGALILASAAFVGTVLAFNVIYRPPATDTETFCRTDLPLAYHAILLVDATDKFSRDQAEKLRATVKEERDAVPQFGKLTILFISPKAPFEPEQLLSMCNPGAGTDANPLFSNPEQIQAVWHQRLADPVNAAVRRLLILPSAPRSPVLESITSITWRNDFDHRVPHRYLRITSDLLQNEPGGYTHYQVGDPWNRFARTTLAKKVDADLTNVVVKIDYLRRPETLQYQNETHKRFWERWLIDHGAASVDFDSRPKRKPLFTPPSNKATDIAGKTDGG